MFLKKLGFGKSGQEDKKGQKKGERKREAEKDQEKEMNEPRVVEPSSASKDPGSGLGTGFGGGGSTSIGLAPTQMVAIWWV